MPPKPTEPSSAAPQLAHHGAVDDLHGGDRDVGQHDRDREAGYLPNAASQGWALRSRIATLAVRLGIVRIG